MFSLDHTDLHTLSAQYLAAQATELDLLQLEYLNRGVEYLFDHAQLLDVVIVAHEDAIEVKRPAYRHHAGREERVHLIAVHCVRSSTGKSDLIHLLIIVK